MSAYLGDFAALTAVDFTFNTRTAAGAPITFATTSGGSPSLRAFRANSTSEITTGITLTVDFAAQTGLHHVRVDSSVGGGATYPAGNTFHVVVQAGSVSGQSVAGETVGRFSIQNRSMEARLPAALVSGRMDSSVGAMAADVLTATALAASATSEIQAGLATSAALATAQADLDDIQTRLPAALVGGLMSSNVTAMSSDTITSAAVAASAVTEIQSGLATSAALVTAQADLDDIQTRLPASLVGGRIDSSVGAMAANVLTASALSSGAVDEIVAAIPSAPTAAVVADAVWDELLAGHTIAGSAGAALTAAGGSADPLLNLVPGTYAVGTAGFSLGRIGSGQIDVIGQVTASSSGATQVTIVQGDTYSAANSNALDFLDVSAAWPDLTNASIASTLKTNPQEAAALSLVGSVVTASGANKKVRLEIASSESSLLTPGVDAYLFDIQSTASTTVGVGLRTTLVLGTVNVLTQLTT